MNKLLNWFFLHLYVCKDEDSEKYIIYVYVKVICY